MNMNNITVSEVNPYTTICNIDGVEVKFVNKNAREAYKTKKRQSLQYIIGVVGCIIFFIFLVGIAGHSDYCEAAKIPDTWSIKFYCFAVAVSVAGLYISGYLIRKFTKD